MHLTDLAEFDESMIAPKLWSTLMPFQRSGVKFVAEHHGRAMIGDDMVECRTHLTHSFIEVFTTDWH